MLFLERRGSFPEILPKKPCLFSLLLIALCLILIFNMVSEACRVCDVSLGSFAVSFSIAHLL